MPHLRSMSTSRRRSPAVGSFQPMAEAHEKSEHPMSVPVATPVESPASHGPGQCSLPVPSRHALAKARWIAESDPRVCLMLARRDLVVSAFISAPHARSGGWTLGVRYMATSHNGLELVVSAVVDLFSGEILSLATFDPMAGAGGT